jgi:hypothetical protein
MSSLLTITEIHVAAAPGGDDTLGDGTPMAPFASLGRAISQSGPGDTITLAAGTFQREAWPIRLPDRAVVRGAGSDVTMIAGPGRSAHGSVAFVAETSAALADLTVTSFETGVHVAAGPTDDVALSRLHLDQCGTTLAVEGGAVTLMDSTIGSPRVGVALAGGSLEIRRSRVDGYTGVSMTAGALTVRDTTFASYDYGLVVSGGDRIDFGHATEPGNNVIVSPYLAAVRDARPPRDQPDGPVITLTGTKLGGKDFPDGTKALGPATSSPYWMIVNPGNRLAFEPATWP